MHFRWQFVVIVACFLLCLFAFQAKLCQYEALHSPLTDVSSNKICSIDKKTIVPDQVTDLSVLISAAIIAVFLFTPVGGTLVRVSWMQWQGVGLRISPVLSSGPTLFRRPPPIL